MNNKNLIYLDTYVLQQDMRVRMPKSILENMNLKKGKSKLKIYYDNINQQLVLKATENKKQYLEEIK